MSKFLFILHLFYQEAGLLLQTVIWVMEGQSVFPHKASIPMTEQKWYPSPGLQN